MKSKQQKRDEAEARCVERTPEEQVKQLDARLGKNIGASKERKKLVQS